MKNSIFTVFVLSFLSSAIAQNYVPFPTQNTMWKQSTTGYLCACCNVSQDIIVGDTVINSLTYHKLRRIGVMFGEDFWGYCSSAITNSFDANGGYFREDVVAKKVYYLAPGSSEQLLYDFNLNVGDTLPLSYTNDGFTINTVLGIDSVFLGGLYRKRFRINDDCSGVVTYLIEGIGYTGGLLQEIRCNPQTETHLLCFTENSQAVYPDSTNTCLITNGIAEKSSGLFSLELIQHHETDELLVHCPNPHQTDLSVSLLDYTGQVINTFGMDSEKLLIDLSGFPAGMYLIRVSGKTIETKPEKFIRL